jgi:hypothetical protein
MRNATVTAVRESTGMRVRDSVQRQIDGVLHDATLTMKRGLRGVPASARGIFYEVSRGRRFHLMGSYPSVASVFAANGAPFTDVIAPMTALKSSLWLRFYALRLPCFFEQNGREEQSNHKLNEAQHYAIRNPRDAELIALANACDEQIAETRMLKAVALAMVSKGIRS